MDAVIESAKGSVEILLKLPILLVLVLAMAILCVVLNRTPLRPWAVQCIVILLPAFLVCFAVPIALKDYQEMWNPVGTHCVRCASIGVVLGYAAARLARPLTKLIEKLVPGFEGDTKFIDKPPL